jgi:hypothetical protein
MASEDASMAPQPLTLDMMEQIEDGDDSALRAFNSAEFEWKSKPKIELGEESTDVDATGLLSLSVNSEII